MRLFSTCAGVKILHYFERLMEITFQDHQNYTMALDAFYSKEKLFLHTCTVDRQKFAMGDEYPLSPLPQEKKFVARSM